MEIHEDDGRRMEVDLALRMGLKIRVRTRICVGPTDSHQRRVTDIELRHKTPKGYLSTMFQKVGQFSLKSQDKRSRRG